MIKPAKKLRFYMFSKFYAKYGNEQTALTLT